MMWLEKEINPLTPKEKKKLIICWPLRDLNRGLPAPKANVLTIMPRRSTPGAFIVTLLNSPNILVGLQSKPCFKTCAPQVNTRKSFQSSGPFILKPFLQLVENFTQGTILFPQDRYFYAAGLVFITLLDSRRVNYLKF